MDFLSDYVFFIPNELFLWAICLWRLVTSIVSESKRPRVPTPAPARYKARGQPIPPEPIRATLALTIFSWPGYAIYFKSICLEYLSRRRPLSA